MSITFDQLFIEFFTHITPEMSPPGMYKHDPRLQKNFWIERFNEAFYGKVSSIKNQSYTELAQLWLAGWRDYERLIDSKKPTK